MLVDTDNLLFFFLLPIVNFHFIGWYCPRKTVKIGSQCRILNSQIITIYSLKKKNDDISLPFTVYFILRRQKRICSDTGVRVRVFNTNFNNISIISWQ